MVKVCLISHGHPAGNPRLVREAHALHDAGFDVVVITPRLVQRLVPFDREIVAGAGWRHRCVDLLPGGTGRWQFVRARRRISASLAGLVRSEALVSRACNYANPELARLAAEERAALYVAHQHHSLPAAAKAAAQTGGRFAFDAEDVLADSSVEPRPLIRDIERRYLAKCAYISTMSDAAAGRLHATNTIARPIVVLHNTLSLSARQGTEPPDRRRRASPPSLYWFGQTIGPHSCAEYVLEALALMRQPLRFVLRGEPTGSYVQHLRTCADRLGLNGRLQIEPLASPQHMVALASAHDILLGSQPGEELFHQLAIGNKVFTGMMAGLALALSDTIAHRDFLKKAPGCGFLFPRCDAGMLARQLDDLLQESGALESQKRASWLLAEREYNWDRESRRLLTIVREWTSRTAA
jgi:glycosyltransferase involved in cell wall biosynthesis